MRKPGVPGSHLQLSQNQSGFPSVSSYWIALLYNEVRGADERLPLQPSLRMKRFQDAARSMSQSEDELVFPTPAFRPGGSCSLHCLRVFFLYVLFACWSRDDGSSRSLFPCIDGELSAGKSQPGGHPGIRAAPSAVKERNAIGAVCVLILRTQIGNLSQHTLPLYSAPDSGY